MNNARFTIMEELDEIGATYDGIIKLTVTSWNGKPAKLDLRTWYTSNGGDELPGRGITFTRDEAHNLMTALQDYFKAEKQ